MDILFPIAFAIPFFLITMVIVVGLGLWTWGLIDALQVPADVFYRSGSKVLWGVLIGVMGPLAALVYFAAGRPDARTRAWMAQQRAAGVDLRAYRVYDVPTAVGPPVHPPVWSSATGHPPTWQQPHPAGPEGFGPDPWSADQRAPGGLPPFPPAR